MRINSIVSKFSNIPLLLQVNEFVNRTQNKYTRFIRMSNISSLYMLPFTSDHFPRNSGHVWEVFGWDLGVGKDPKSPDSWSVQYPLVFAEFWLFASSQLPFKQGAALLTAAAASHKSVVHTSHVQCQSLARWVYRWSDVKLKRIEKRKNIAYDIWICMCLCRKRQLKPCHSSWHFYRRPSGRAKQALGSVTKGGFHGCARRADEGDGGESTPKEINQKVQTHRVRTRNTTPATSRPHISPLPTNSEDMSSRSPWTPFKFLIYCLAQHSQLRGIHNRVWDP